MLASHSPSGLVELGAISGELIHRVCGELAPQGRLPAWCQKCTVLGHCCPTAWHWRAGSILGAPLGEQPHVKRSPRLKEFSLQNVVPPGRAQPLPGSAHTAVPDTHQ